MGQVLAIFQKYVVWVYLICLVALLWAIYELLAARRQRAATIFSLEKEMATAREMRSVTSLVAILILIAAVTILEFRVLPGVQLPTIAQATPTSPFLIVPPTRTPLPSATAGPPTPTRVRPTPGLPSPMPTYTPTPLRLAPCPNPGVCITSPAWDAQLSGVVQIVGTASIERFQFYKIEYGLGDNPEAWNSVGEVHREPVSNGLLGTWDVSGFPRGVYKLRLTVVDITGNFGPPCEVRVTISE
ncbi:MAG: hypothetical protein H5T64_09140 [Chloroflexi bacterium]|nr:hypothetical protein [Chloroflexota bacterium]